MDVQRALSYKTKTTIYEKTALLNDHQHHDHSLDAREFRGGAPDAPRGLPPQPLFLLYNYIFLSTVLIPRFSSDAYLGGCLFLGVQRFLHTELAARSFPFGQHIGRGK